MKKLYNKIKAKIIGFGAVGGIFTGVGALGAFGVCHSICQATIAFLAIFGITIIGMPLAFLQKPVFYIPFAAIGIASLSGSVYLYVKHKKCKNEKK